MFLFCTDAAHNRIQSIKGAIEQECRGVKRPFLALAADKSNYFATFLSNTKTLLVQFRLELEPERLTYAIYFRTQRTNLSWIFPVLVFNSLRALGFETRQFVSYQLGCNLMLKMHI